MSDWDILLLDISGSMTKSKNDLINGFNELVNEQQKEKGDNLFPVLTFNDEVEEFKEDKFKNFKAISGLDIITEGTTALYDAIGNAYDMILENKKHKSVTLTVITDGLENGSKIYTIDVLNNKKKEVDKFYTIEMVFIGTDISCITGDTIELHASQRIDCDGNIHKALRIASREMSSRRDSARYTQDESCLLSVKSQGLKRSRSFPL